MGKTSGVCMGGIDRLLIQTARAGRRGERQLDMSCGMTVVVGYLMLRSILILAREERKLKVERFALFNPSNHALALNDVVHSIRSPMSSKGELSWCHSSASSAHPLPFCPSPSYAEPFFCSPYTRVLYMCSPECTVRYRHVHK